MKREIKIHSAFDQILTYLNITPKDEVCFSSLEREIIEHFDYLTFIDLLLGLSEVNFQLRIVVILSTDTYEKMHLKAFKKWELYKQDMSEVSYLCRLLKCKHDFLENLNKLSIPLLERLDNPDKGDNNHFIRVLDQYIFEELMLINSNLDENCINTSNCFALLFLENKKQAINSFLNYVSKEIIYEGGKSNHQSFILSKDRFFHFLQLDFVPNISYSNYKQSLNLFKEENMIISKKQIDIVIGQEEFFQKKLPLHELKLEELFSFNNDFPKEKVDYMNDILKAFFEVLCENKFTYGETNVFKLFFSSCTEIYPSYSKDELYYAYNLLNELVSKDKVVFYQILSVFIVLHNSDAIKLVPTKLPKILSAYFKGSTLSQSTMRQYISGKAKYSKEFLSILNEVNDWVVASEKGKRVNFQRVI
ncbi:hypothetical protein HXZ81_06010 [Myroides odoratimimus]|uniref:hypothetical protein n=2 Tax=Myroides odoratimimus TaxID=76832 RepID=UPI002577B513|nr:hypothetical protein [Myroides odoratimimus]MDM1096204.1 hypothetical protein [Myroides odoratimimus]